MPSSNRRQLDLPKGKEGKRKERKGRRKKGKKREGTKGRKEGWKERKNETNKHILIHRHFTEPTQWLNTKS